MKTYTTKANATRAARNYIKGIAGEAFEVAFEVTTTEKGLFTYSIILPEDTCPQCFATPEDGVHTVESIADASPEAAAKMKLDHTCLACGEDFGKPIKPAEEATKPQAPKKAILRKSETKSPCLVVWETADEMKDAKRKDVIAACVEKGVAFYTARTQYQLWKQAGNATVSK